MRARLLAGLLEARPSELSAPQVAPPQRALPQVETRALPARLLAELLEAQPSAELVVADQQPSAGAQPKARRGVPWAELMEPPRRGSWAGRQEPVEVLLPLEAALPALPAAQSELPEWWVPQAPEAPQRAREDPLSRVAACL